MDSDPFYALLEASRFAAHWLSFCKIFNMEPRVPEVYFAEKSEPRNDRQWLAMKKLYEEMKQRIEAEVKCGTISEELRKSHEGFSEWSSRVKKGNNQTIFHLLILQNRNAVDNEEYALPSLVYLAREKRSQHPHNFKAGAMNALSLLSVNTRGRLAIGEGEKVSIFDVGQLIGQETFVPVTADKTNVKPLSKNVVCFEVVHLIFNPAMENYLVVAGYEECQVLTLNPRGEVTDRVLLELSLQGAYIRRVDWVPGSQVQLMVVTNMLVKIYNLSQDNTSPIHYFTLSDDYLIVDATLVVGHKGHSFLLTLSELGCLFRLQLSLDSDVGAKPLKQVIQDVFAQNMHHTALPLVGITAYKPLSKDKSHYLVLHDDGSLQIYSHIPLVGADGGGTVSSGQTKKLGSDILYSKVYDINSEFPFDFFEKTVCITANGKLSGDAIRNNDSEGTKQSLASDDGFLESPNPAGFK
ncbi:hypothetical protein GIB67_012072, partial [Kingdonia uniflora]